MVRCLLLSSWIYLKSPKHLSAYENEIIQMSLQMLQMASEYSINAKKISSPHTVVSVCKWDQERNDQMHTNSWWKWFFFIPVVRISIFKILTILNSDFFSMVIKDCYLVVITLSLIWSKKNQGSVVRCGGDKGMSMIIFLFLWDQWRDAVCSCMLGGRGRRHEKDSWADTQRKP